MLMVVFDVTAMFVSIMVSHVFSNMLMMMNVTTFCMMATMMLHVALNMLVVMLDVTAMLHTMNVAMLLGVRMLDMMQMGFTMMLSPATMEGVLVVSNMIVMFHD
jgi:hypothetical protein